MKKTVIGKQLASLFLVLGLVVGCASSPTEQAQDQNADVKQAIDAAKAAIAKAKALDWIWRDTGKFLKQAQAAADKGENSAAIKLANKARFQAEAAVIQYNHEKKTPRGL